DLREELRHVRQQRGEEQGELRPLTRRGEELLRVLRQELGVAARTILQHERDATGGADARDDGRREGERLRLGKAGEPAVKVAHDDLRGQSVLVPLLPVLQRDEVEEI